MAAAGVLAVSGEAGVALANGGVCALPVATCGTALLKSAGVEASAGPATNTPKPKATKSLRLCATIPLSDVPMN